MINMSEFFSAPGGASTVVATTDKESPDAGAANIIGDRTDYTPTTETTVLTQTITTTETSTIRIFWGTIISIGTGDTATLRLKRDGVEKDSIAITGAYEDIATKETVETGVAPGTYTYTITLVGPGGGTYYATSVIHIVAISE